MDAILGKQSGGEKIDRFEVSIDRRARSKSVVAFSAWTCRPLVCEEQAQLSIERSIARSWKAAGDLLDAIQKDVLLWIVPIVNGTPAVRFMTR